MSHHGNDPSESAMRELIASISRQRDEEVSSHLKAAQAKVQGEYPDGRLKADDDGAVLVAIGHDDGKVVMRFPHTLTWIGFSAQQAMDIAATLVEHARQCGATVPLTLKV